MKYLPWSNRLRVMSPPTTGKHSGFAMGRPSTCDVTTNNGETLRICHGPTVYVWRHHQHRGNTQDLPWADRLPVTSQPTTGKHSGFAMGRPSSCDVTTNNGETLGFAMGLLSTCDVTTNNGETLRICHGPTVYLWRHNQQRRNTQDLPWADRLCVTSPPTTGIAIDFLHKDKALVSTLILQHQRGEPPRKGVKRSTQ